VGSRPYLGNRVPQHVQNLVIRDCCRRHGLEYLLSATEYAMPGCYMMLERVMEELPAIEGVVLYSLFMMPEDREYRESVYRRVLEGGARLYAAVEGFAITDADDVARVEDVWRVEQCLPRCWTGEGHQP
jgi:sporadic carbohydrate cluster protein (TIGR04323 family)